MTTLAGEFGHLLGQILSNGPKKIALVAYVSARMPHTRKRGKLLNRCVKAGIHLLGGFGVILGDVIADFLDVGVGSP